MRSKALMAIAWCLLGSLAALSQGGGATGQAPVAETVAPNIPGVVAGGTKVQLLQEGLQGAQGATSLPDGTLLFTERNVNRINKVDKDGNISSYMEDTSATNSFSFDPKGRVIGVQYTPAQVGVLAPVKTTLADQCDGNSFGRPNDLVIDKKGGVYFTDDLGKPTEGIKPRVCYIKPDGGVIKITDDIARPNGIQLSPDERILYVDDTNGDAIRAFDVQPDGSTRNERIFATITEGLRKTDAGATSSGADGLAIDGAGRLYVTAYSGVQVFSPQGRYLGSIPIPRQASNLAFAGPDKKTLYVLSINALYKIPMLTEGYMGRAK